MVDTLIFNAKNVAILTELIKLGSFVDVKKFCIKIVLLDDAI